MTNIKHQILRIKEASLTKLLLVNKVDIIWIFIASSVSNLLMLTPMLYMLQIFDRIFISQSVITLLTVSGIIIFFYIISSLSSYIRSQIIIALGSRLENKINEHLFHVSFSERLKKEVKNPVSYLDDLTVFRQWLTGAAVFAIFDLPWVPLYVLIMFVMHPLLGFASLVLILILIVFGIYFSKILGNQDEILRQEEYETNEFLYGKLRNSEILSIYALASNFKENWRRNKRKFYISLNKSQKKTDVIKNIMKQYRFFTNSLALTIGAYLVISGELTLGSMIAASLLMARTTQPVDGAVSTLSRITIVREAFWRLEEMLKVPFARNMSSAGEKQISNNGITQNTVENISLSNVEVSYDDGNLIILKSLSFELHKGEVISVVGNSGSGKTTMLKLLSGLVDYRGSVLYENVELKTFSREDSERCIGYLPQDVLMIPGTVAENISSLRLPDSKRIVEVAKLVGIHDFILKFSEGYDTRLFGGRQNLSGGERQRIGLARAIYNDPASIILDEPNAALDHSGELALNNVIKYCKNRGKIIVIVTHRRSVLKCSDKVIDLSSNSESLKPVDRETYLGSFKSKEDFDKRFTF